jgi:hypothetical protein
MSGRSGCREEPVDDGVVTLLRERMATWVDAATEGAGGSAFAVGSSDRRNDLVRIRGVLVILPGQDEEGSWRHCCQDLVDVELAGDTRHREEQVDADVSGDLLPVGAGGAADAGERNTLVDRRLKDGHVPPIRVPRNPDASRIDPVQRPQRDTHTSMPEEPE